jgi:predicted  nucleic acid-binding Zn-ribbon protein
VQATELSTWQRRVSELTSRISELEEALAKTQKELLKAQEANAKLQRDLRENVAQKEDQVGIFSFLLFFSLYSVL